MAKRAVVEQVANKVAGGASEMADVLKEIARTGTDERARVAAAKVFLDFANRYRADLVIETRLARIEKLLEDEAQGL
mgnify:FL=1